MTIVSTVLHIEYVDQEQPDVDQTLIWSTFDESPDFPRLMAQIEQVADQEGRKITNWVIAQNGSLVPKQTHKLQTVTRH